MTELLLYLIPILPCIAATIFINRLTRKSKIVIPLSILLSIFIIFLGYTIFNGFGTGTEWMFFILVMFMGPAEVALVIFLFLSMFLFNLNEKFNYPLEKLPVIIVALISISLVTIGMTVLHKLL